MGAIKPHNTEVDDRSSWNGPGAVASMPNDRKTLNYCHAWVDSDGDPDAKSSYKIPHHRTLDGPANGNALRNGKARLSQTDVPEKDKAGIGRHLDRHMAALDATLSNGEHPGELMEGTHDQEVIFGAATGEVIKAQEGAAPEKRRARVVRSGWAEIPGGPYYFGPGLLSEQTIPRDTPMLADHPDPFQEMLSVWGSVRDMAGVLTSEARWEGNGPLGPGLYADIEILDPDVTRVADYIELSIRAFVEWEWGEAEGKEGKIVTEWIDFLTVDFVIRGGAGGEMFAAMAANRRKIGMMPFMSGENTGLEPKKSSTSQPSTTQAAASQATTEAPKSTEDDRLTKLEASLKTLQDQNQALTQANADLRSERAAFDLAQSKIAAAELPKAAEAKVTDRIVAARKLDDKGMLDVEHLGAEADRLIKEEQDYIKELAPEPQAPVVQGFGASQSNGDKSDDDAKNRLVAAMVRQGMTEEQAKKVAARY